MAKCILTERKGCHSLDGFMDRSNNMHHLTLFMNACPCTPTFIKRPKININSEFQSTTTFNSTNNFHPFLTGRPYQPLCRPSDYVDIHCDEGCSPNRTQRLKSFSPRQATRDAQEERQHGFSNARPMPWVQERMEI